MFCSNCGSVIKEGDKFCTKCGTPVFNVDLMDDGMPTVQEDPSQSVSVTPAQSAQPTQPTQPAQQAAAEPHTEPASAAPASMVKTAVQSGPVNPSSAPKPTGKKHKTGKIILCCVLAAALVLGVFTAFNFKRAKNFVVKTFSSPDKYYQYVEGNELKTLAEDVPTIYENLWRDNVNYTENGYEANAELTLGDEGKNLLYDAADIDLGDLDTIGITGKAQVNTDKVAESASISLSGNQILSVNSIMDLTNEMLYEQIPELSEDYFRQDLSDSYDYSMEEMRDMLKKLPEYYDAMPDKELVKTLMTRYVTLILTDMTNVQKGSGTLTAGGVSQNCTKLTVTITKDDFRKIVKDVATAMKDDNDVKSLIMGMAELDEYTTPEAAYESFQESLQNTLDELDDEFEDMENITMVVWVDDEGVVKGRSITSDGTTVTYAAPENSGKIGLEISENGSYSTVSLTGAGTKKGSKVTGQYALKSNDEEVMTVNVEDFDMDTMKQGYINGKISASLDSFLADADVDRTIRNLLEGAQLSLNIESSKGSTKVAADLSVSSGELLSVSASVNEVGKETIKDVDSVSMDDWADSISSDDLQKIIDKLEAAGLPTTYVEQLQSMIDYYNN